MQPEFVFGANHGHPVIALILRCVRPWCVAPPEDTIRNGWPGR